MRDKVTRQCPETTTFEEKGEPKRIRTEVPLLTSLTPYRLAKSAHMAPSLIDILNTTKQAAEKGTDDHVMFLVLGEHTCCANLTV